jgi:DNA end-binding protein Ku
MPRSICSATITFGLISIPVKFFTSAAEVTIAFHQMSPAGHRIRQKNFDSVTDHEVPYGDIRKGYEVAKDNYVVFTREELKGLEAECEAKTIDITEFVDSTSIDPIMIEQTYYLGPDKGADKAVLLLAETLNAMGRVAIAQWNSRGKEHLVAIRSYKGGLILHRLFYASEIRNFSEIEVATRQPISDQERKMACKLVASMSSGEFSHTEYQDTYRARLQDAIDAKAAGGVIKSAGPVEGGPKGGVLLDLSTLLEQSLAAAPKLKAKKGESKKKNS